MLAALGGPIGGWRLCLAAGAAAILAAVFLYVGHLEHRIEQQAAIIASQAADLDRAAAVTRENAAVLARQEAEHHRIVGALEAASAAARIRAARYAAPRQEIDHAQPSDARPLGPAALRALDRLRGTGTPGGADGAEADRTAAGPR